METSTRKGQLAMYSSLSIVGTLSVQIVPPTVGNDTVYHDAVRHLLVRVSASQTFLYELHISELQITTKKEEKKGVNLSHQAGLSEEAQTGRLSASKGTGSQENSHFMAFSCGPLCEVSSFVSH